MMMIDDDDEEEGPVADRLTTFVEKRQKNLKINADDRWLKYY